MDVLAIGYRNHSKRIIDILSKNKKISKVFVYIKNRSIYKKNTKKINYLYNLKNLEAIDCFFILSPADTHLYYIKKILKYKKKIFCEKPACVNSLEYKFLNNLNKKDKTKIYFNFNLRHSDFFKIFKKKILEKKIGLPSYFYFKSTNGIVYKKKLRNNWRFKSNNIFHKITGNVGVHYINFFLGLYPSTKKIEVIENNISNKGKDFAKIDLNYNSTYCTILLSYAGPADYRIELNFTNGILIFNNNLISLNAPRNTFDKKNNFVNPPMKILKRFSSYKNYIHNSQENSVDFFLKGVQKKIKFSLGDFNDAINSSKLLLDAKIK